MLGAPTRFAESFLQSKNPFGLALVTCLGWVAACDDHLDESEIQFLHSVARDELQPSDIEAAINVARSGNLRDIQLACEVLTQLDDSRKRLLLDLIVGIAVVDGRLAISENHVVRFFADLMRVSAASLDDIYRNHTGGPRPASSDPSSADWWTQRDQGKTSQRRGRRSTAHHHKGSREEALAILGLGPSATSDEIRLAYRRLAKSHHPDKYESLGPEAVKAATKTFQTIQAAYERVRES